MSSFPGRVFRHTPLAPAVRYIRREKSSGYVSLTNHNGVDAVLSADLGDAPCAGAIIPEPGFSSEAACGRRLKTFGQSSADVTRHTDSTRATITKTTITRITVFRRPVLICQIPFTIAIKPNTAINANRITIKRLCSGVPVNVLPPCETPGVSNRGPTLTVISTMDTTRSKPIMS